MRKNIFDGYFSNNKIDKVELIDIFYEYNLFETLEEILKSQTSGKSATAKVQPNLPKSLKTQKKKPKSTMDIELYQKNANY